MSSPAYFLQPFHVLTTRVLHFALEFGTRATVSFGAAWEVQDVVSVEKTAGISVGATSFVILMPTQLSRNARMMGTVARKPNGRDYVETVRNRNYTDETVELDDHRFIDCTLQHCTLRYEGGEFELVGTRLTGCSWEMGGPAYRTLNVLQQFDLPVRSARLFEATRVF